MPYEPPVAVYDACVLYPFHLRNLLIQCAVDRLVEARWTDDIHEEWIRNLAADTPGLTEERLRATRDLMKAVLPGANVEGHRSLISGLTLPDPDDRHVMAAALAGGASVIVTWNARDFPTEVLTGHGLKRQDPDMFLCGLFAAAPDVVVASVAEARRNLRRTTPAADDFLDTLDRQGLSAFAEHLRLRIAEI